MRHAIHIKKRALLLAAACLFAAWALAGPARAEDREAVGRVARVQGQAWVLEADMRFDLAPGLPLFEGQTLATGPEARLFAVFHDGTELTLGAETRITVDEYVLGRDGGRALLRMAGTAFRAVTGRIAKAGGTFEVATPLATLGIRGTDFWGGHFTPGVLDVLMLSGTAVAVRTPAGERLLSEPGQGVTVGADGAAGPVKRWPEAKVGRAVETVTFR